MSSNTSNLFIDKQ
jgi:hypothetical protein